MPSTSVAEAKERDEDEEPSSPHQMQRKPSVEQQDQGSIVAAESIEGGGDEDSDVERRPEPLQLPPKPTTHFHCPMPDDLSHQFMDTQLLFEALELLDGHVLPHVPATMRVHLPSADRMSPLLEDDEEEYGTDGDGGVDGEAHGSSLAQLPPPPSRPPPPATYVYCHSGLSASPALVMAFLMSRLGRPLQRAVDHLGPRCRPNPNFIRQLAELDAQFRPSRTREGSVQEPPFDLEAYYVDGLCQAFPNLCESDVCAALRHSNGDVVAARAVLLRKTFAERRVQTTPK